ncbi:hypothetical protein FKM82_003382 [Ascaphus truei]
MLPKFAVFMTYQHILPYLRKSAKSWHISSKQYICCFLQYVVGLQEPINQDLFLALILSTLIHTSLSRQKSSLHFQELKKKYSCLKC